MIRYRWTWVNARDLTVGQYICLDCASPDTSDEYDLPPRQEVVFMYSEHGGLQSFITHDGIERKLPSNYTVWAQVREESTSYA